MPTGASTGVSGRLRGRPVTVFFAATFLYSWGLFALLYAVLGADRLGASRLWHLPFAWGPPLGAMVATRTSGDGVAAWLRRVADPRTGFGWYVVALLLPFLFADTRSVIAAAAGVRLELARPIADVLGSFVLTLFLAGSLEEFGWRGFAQHRLQERFGALKAAGIVGVAFGLWHFPWLLLGGAGFGVGGVGALVEMILFAVLASVVFAWMFNGSGGAVPVVMLAHATINTGTLFEPADPLPGWLPDTQLGLFLWVALAVGLVVVYGQDRLAPRKPAPFWTEGSDRAAGRRGEPG